MTKLRVTAIVRNPADPERYWQGPFLVTAGGMDSILPRPHLEAIGLNPKGRRVYELADGSKAVMDIATGEIEVMGETVGGTVLFGDADAEPVLDKSALASAGIEVGPTGRTLEPRRAVRLKSARAGV